MSSVPSSSALPSSGAKPVTSALVYLSLLWLLVTTLTTRYLQANSSPEAGQKGVLETNLWSMQGLATFLIGLPPALPPSLFDLISFTYLVRHFSFLEAVFGSKQYGAIVMCIVALTTVTKKVLGRLMPMLPTLFGQSPVQKLVQSAATTTAATNFVAIDPITIAFTVVKNFLSPIAEHLSIPLTIHSVTFALAVLYFLTLPSLHPIAPKSFRTIRKYFPTFTDLFLSEKIFPTFVLLVLTGLYPASAIVGVYLGGCIYTRYSVLSSITSRKYLKTRFAR